MCLFVERVFVKKNTDVRIHAASKICLGRLEYEDTLIVSQFFSNRLCNVVIESLAVTAIGMIYDSIPFTESTL